MVLGPSAVSDVVPTNHLLLPSTGEIVDLANVDGCVKALSQIRDLETRLKDAKKELTFYIIQESQRQGTKTLHVGDVTAEVKGGSGITWDVQTLEELLALGLPEDRFNKMVQPEITYKVSTLEANRIAGSNPAYKEVIDRAKQTYDKEQYVSIRRG
jgi:hypothetical protein